ncbi:MAG: hypothetical protein ACK4E0_02955 [Chitinophagaceae bacterium]|jgi:hypothetical protein
MKTEILHKKLERYVSGKATPAETRQIQTWLSCTAKSEGLRPEEKSQLEMEILVEIQAYTAYPLYKPDSEQGWWRKISAMF